MKERFGSWDQFCEMHLQELADEFIPRMTSSNVPSSVASSTKQSSSGTVRWKQVGWGRICDASGKQYWFGAHSAPEFDSLRIDDAVLFELVQVPPLPPPARPPPSPRRRSAQASCIS